jgi:hypothetical protein
VDNFVKIIVDKVDNERAILLYVNLAMSKKLEKTSFVE